MLMICSKCHSIMKPKEENDEDETLSLYKCPNCGLKV